jgi:hypothetical protein
MTDQRSNNPTLADPALGPAAAVAPVGRTTSAAPASRALRPAQMTPPDDRDPLVAEEDRAQRPAQSPLAAADAGGGAPDSAYEHN